MKWLLTHAHDVKTINDIWVQLELKADRLEVVKSDTIALYIELYSRKSQVPKQKNQNRAKRKSEDNKSPKRSKRGKRAGKRDPKDPRKSKCFNCEQLGHFVHDCTEPRKTQGLQSI